MVPKAIGNLYRGIIGICIALAMLLSACGPQPTPTEEPITPSTTGGACEGMRIVFFPGGYAACPFTSILHKGAATAAADLGADVEYMFSDWDPDKMVQQFEEAVATHPDGIAVMGLPGDDALESAIDDARTKGIIVTSQNVMLPRAEAKYKGEGFGYAGQELYESGYALGQEAIRRTGFGAGDRALVWGFLAVPTLGLRTQGILDALEEAGLTVDYIEIDPATDADYYGAGPPIFTEYVSSHPDVKLVATDHGGLTMALQTLLEAAGKGPQEIYTVGFDLCPVVLEGIRGGWIDLVLDQQPFLQGYLPILQICLTKKYQVSGLHIDTGGGFVHQDNVEVLAPLVERQLR
jgi:simple sugar transport system substrate-binding protein